MVIKIKEIGLQESPPKKKKKTIFQTNYVFKSSTNAVTAVKRVMYSAVSKPQNLQTMKPQNIFNLKGIRYLRI